MKVRKYLSLLAAGLSCGITHLSAAVLYWDATDATGNWNTTQTGVWFTAASGGSAATWTNGSDAQFFTNGATGNYTITVGTVTANSITKSTGAGTLSLNGGSGVITNTTGNIQVDSGVLTINTGLAGSNGLTKLGAGTLNLLGTNKSYTGNTTVSAGTVRVLTTTALPQTTVVSIASGANFSYYNLSGSTTIAGISGAGTLSGDNASASQLEVKLSNNSTNQNFSGVITNSGGQALALRKEGSYQQILSGTSSNTYSGLTAVTQGKLVLDKTNGATAIAGNTQIDGGTLEIWQSEQIADGSTVNLNGGILSFSDAGGQTSLLETVNLLSLSSGSTIDFGGLLNGATFSINSLSVTSGILSINNWTEGVDVFRSFNIVSNDALAAIQFSGYQQGANVIDMGGWYQITPVPEPSVVLLAGFAFAALLVSRRGAARKA